MKALLLGLLLAAVVQSSAVAQAAAPDSGLVTASVRQLKQRYAQAVGEASHLYSGPEYVDYRKSYMKGHQFFQSRDEAPGTIHYNGFLFADVPMRYDVYQDQLVLEHRASGLKMKLVNEKVRHFTVHGHTFVRVPADSVGKAAIAPGYYDLLADGRARMLVKRGKNMDSRPGSTSMEGEFTEWEKYVVQTEGRYYPISSKGQLLKALTDKKKELQQYAAEQRLSFARDSRAQSIAALVRRYNQLAPPLPSSN